MTLSTRDRLAIETARAQQRAAGRVNLRELGARNTSDKRTRMAREDKARRVAADRKTGFPSPREAVRPPDVPLTFKAGTERRRVTRPATSAPVPDVTPAPKITPAPVAPKYKPVKASELDDDMRAHAAKVLKEGTAAGWRLVGVLNVDGVKVYVRKHSTGVRYALHV